MASHSVVLYEPWQGSHFHLLWRCDHPIWFLCCAVPSVTATTRAVCHWPGPRDWAARCVWPDCIRCRTHRIRPPCYCNFPLRIDLKCYCNEIIVPYQFRKFPKKTLSEVSENHFWKKSENHSTFKSKNEKHFKKDFDH